MTKHVIAEGKILVGKAGITVDGEPFDIESAKRKVRKEDERKRSSS